MALGGSNLEPKRSKPWGRIINLMWYDPPSFAVEVLGMFRHIRFEGRFVGNFMGRLMGLLLVAIVAGALPAYPLSTNFDIVKVADGVYATIAKNGAASNGAFIVNDDVVVVDAHLRPSWAREVIAEIKKITDKPVRYLIDTHYHTDHVQGNQAYVDAFPGVTIIQQDLTREDMIQFKPGPITPENVYGTIPPTFLQMKKQLADGKDDHEKKLTAEERADLQHQVDLRAGYIAEAPQIRFTPGNLTFSKSLTLHESGRDIFLYYFGYAHTRGDTIIYLPADKIVLTGDVLESQVPMMAGSYPVKWISVLDSIDKLDWNAVIPGHGGVQQGRQNLVEFKGYLTDLVAGAKQAADKGLTQEQAAKSIDLSKYSKMAHFAERNPAAVARAYLEATGKVSD
jgi:cyclase